MARLGARITKLETARPRWWSFRLDIDRLPQDTRNALAGARGPLGFDLGSLSNFDLEALVALGDEYAA